MHWNSQPLLVVEARINPHSKLLMVKDTTQPSSPKYHVRASRSLQTPLSTFPFVLTTCCWIICPERSQRQHSLTELDNLQIGQSKLTKRGWEMIRRPGLCFCCGNDQQRVSQCPLHWTTLHPHLALVCPARCFVFTSTLRRCVLSLLVPNIPYISVWYSAPVLLE